MGQLSWSEDAEGAVKLAWTAEDDDGDPLAYDVVADTPSGSVVVGAGLTEPALHVPARWLRGGSLAIRVVASDGFGADRRRPREPSCPR